MHVTSQTDQTLSLFRTIAEDWQESAEAGRSVPGNIVWQRNSAVLSISEDLGYSPHRLLDVGCGSGQLTIEAAKRGMMAVGVDFALEMIAKCEANRVASGVDARFVCTSALDFVEPEEPFDIVSAQGFIEYISQVDLELFFAKAARMIRPGGALALGSRNRLFNLFSTNRFTALELELGVLDDLVREAYALSEHEDTAVALAAARDVARMLPHPSRHPFSGMDVESRYQYTPGELIRRLNEHGFQARAIYPIHFHGLPVALKNSYPDLHVKLADLIFHREPRNHKLLPMSSSFVLDARKTADGR